jgi:hypothetical protein
MVTLPMTGICAGLGYFYAPARLQEAALQKP